MHNSNKGYRHVLTKKIMLFLPIEDAGTIYLVYHYSPQLAIVSVQL